MNDESTTNPNKHAAQETAPANSVADAMLSGEVKKALAYIKSNRAIDRDTDVDRQIQKHLDFLAANAPDEHAKSVEILNNGKEIAKIFQRAWKAGSSGNEEKMEKLRKEIRQYGPEDFELKRLEKKYAGGKARHDAFAEQGPCTVEIPPPDYDVSGPNPHAIQNLKPSRHWFVAMDETGSGFDSQTVAALSRRSGKYVSILVPEESNLKRLKSVAHATESSDTQAAELLADLYASRPYCGILGVTLEGMAAVSEYAHVNYWYNLIERSIDIILRLIPLCAEGPVALTFLVEERGMDAKSQRGTLEHLLNACLYRLAKTDPEREKAIQATIEVVSKQRSKNADFTAYNGYADALACAWFNIKNRWRVPPASLKDYGLIDTCLLSGVSQNIADLIDSVKSGVPLPPAAWSELFSSVADVRSLTTFFLEKFGEQVRADKELWTIYLEETKRHLDSHAIQLSRLSRQITWLAVYKPDGVALPPRLELLWLTVNLAHANHRGAVEEQMARVKVDMARFRQLIRDLYEEDAPLACWATLHLAVQATDAFDFTKARDLVRAFLDIGIKKAEARGFIAKVKSLLPVARGKSEWQPAANPSVMGLRYYGQLLSSLGQHEAFVGNLSAAQDYFRKAIDAFGRLSEDKALDIDQTTAYLVTAMMDDPAVDDKTLLKTIEGYLGAPLGEAVAKLAVSTAPFDKFHHHILLRYIASGRAPAGTAESYLALRKDWAHSEDGHPWELIEFYRGILTPEAAEKAELLTRAFDIARRGGPTLQVIGCVILNALLPFAPAQIDRFKMLVEGVRKTLPALGRKRLDALEAAIDAPQPPLEFASKILPFNFR